MDRSQFELQMQRLKDQWPAAYSAERLKLLWMAFKDVGGMDFQEAVDELLMTQRGAPLLEEISKAVQLAKNRYFERLRAKDASILGMMHEAAEVNTTADPAFVEDCLNLLDQLLSKKTTYNEFIQGCELLTVAANQFAKEKGYYREEVKPIKNLPVKYNPSDN
jgi:hypothetical protein